MIIIPHIRENVKHSIRRIGQLRQILIQHIMPDSNTVLPKMCFFGIIESFHKFTSKILLKRDSHLLIFKEEL